MRRCKPGPRPRGERAESDVTDAQAWLQLYNGAVAANKGHGEAESAADRGMMAFRRRFPTAAAAAAGREARAKRNERIEQETKAKEGGA